MQRLRIEAIGIVQGVGFRPFIYKLATRYKLSGFVFNDSKGAVVEVEGNGRVIKDFLRQMQTNIPPLAVFEKIVYRRKPPQKDKLFVIKKSRSKSDKFTFICPDISTCENCLEELFDAQDRRYKYPFINCTNCGPRFTILKDIPYDRWNTTMRKFKMCGSCQQEYDDTSDRRFHAQPNACPKCGPQVRLIKGDTTKVSSLKNPIKQAARLLAQGKILAIKGLGGYHLACDARNRQAVRALRKRKYRQDKPFALMTDSLKSTKKFCKLSRAEEELLISPRRPIVLLEKKRKSPVIDEVAPKQNYLGIMLPYSPLHYLLLKEFSRFNSSYPIFVMTSGNFHDEPIAYKDREARSRLNKIADYFLIHDRDIHMRTDDSVVRIFKDRKYVIRRSRGYVPEALKLNISISRPVLGCGAELKNTFCLARDNFAFLSHHIGDLENCETLRSFEEGIQHFRRIFNIRPQVIAYDMHPEYISTKYALDLKGSKYSLVPVQHHHAHVVSCMAENKLDEKVIGIAFDGLGYGDDGTFWGGEFLIADCKDYKRVAHLAYIPLLGGRQAILEPWRLAAAWLYQIYGEALLKLDIDFIRRLDKTKCNRLCRLYHSDLMPSISSMGRLFDAASSLLGIRDIINYEGQAAIELEMLIRKRSLLREVSPFKYRIVNKKDVFIIEPHLIFKGIIQDLKKRIALETIALRFHKTVAHLTRDTCLQLRDIYHINKVVLSGGVFQNMVLLDTIYEILRESNFSVFTHSQVPVNDGGISLGQVVIANYKAQTRDITQ